MKYVMYSRAKVSSAGIISILLGLMYGSVRPSQRRRNRPHGSPAVSIAPGVLPLRSRYSHATVELARDSDQSRPIYRPAPRF